MSDRKVVIFQTSGVDADERLIRQYIVPAFRRLGERADVKWLIFNRYGHDPSVDGGEVLFSIFGDVETVAADERKRWNRLVADGLAEAWWTDDTSVELEEIDEREYLRFRMRATASRMSVEFFEEFDTFPDSVNEFDDEPSETYTGVGWWMCLHHLINQLGYQRNGGEEEIDLLFEELRNRLYGLSSCFGPGRAEQKIDELQESLEALPQAVQRYREEHGEHQHTYADRESFEEG